MNKKTLFNNKNKAIEIAKEDIFNLFPEGWDFKVSENIHIPNQYFIEYFNKEAGLHAYQNEIGKGGIDIKKRFVVYHDDDILTSYVGSGDTPKEAIKNIRKKIKNDIEYLEIALKKILK